MKQTKTTVPTLGKCINASKTLAALSVLLTTSSSAPLKLYRIVTYGYKCFFGISTSGLLPVGSHSDSLSSALTEEATQIHCLKLESNLCMNN